MTASGADAARSRQAGLTAVGCGVLVAGLIAVDMPNPALPAIVAGLHTTQSAMKRMVGLYLLALAAAQLVYGRLSDRHGRRPALLLGLALAALGQAASATAGSIGQLDAARVLTACGAATCTVSSRAITKCQLLAGQDTRGWRRRPRPRRGSASIGKRGASRCSRWCSVLAAASPRRWR